MDIRYKLYPYPVLTYYSDDYVGSVFDTAVEISKSGYDLHISFLTALDNKELTSLIESGKACFVYHMECAQTGFRTVVKTSDTEFLKVIPDKNICGKLKICPFIVALEDISDYVSNSFNDDYRGYKFQIECGCVMAVGKQINFDIEKNNNDLASAKSIFVITKDADPNALEMSIDIERPKITIKLPETDYFRYKNMSEAQDVQDTLNCMLIIPALIYVLEEVTHCLPDERYENYSSYNWYKSIKRALKKHFKRDLEQEEFHPSEIILYAQKLIKSPLSASLEYLALGRDSGEEDDE